MPSCACAFVTGTGWADRTTAATAEAEGAGGATTNTRGSTVSPAMVRDVRNWGNERPKLWAPASAPFLLFWSVFTKRSYRTTKSVY